MNEPEKCNKCGGMGYYHIGSVATACDCKALLRKYNRLLEFVKSLNVVTTKSSNHPYYDGYVDGRNSTARVAKDVLKEIGEPKE